MAYLPDCASVAIEQFNGIWVPSAVYGVDDTRIPISHGRAGKNMQYFADGARTRFGHQEIFTPGDSATSAVNWMFTSGTPATRKNYIAWFSPGIGVRYADLGLATPVPVTAIPQTTAADAVIMPLGSRLYAAFIDSTGLGMAGGQVFDPATGADPLFAPPITTTPTFTELGGTYTTTGAKLFGYLIQTRNGYITRPSPAPTDSFTATSYTSLGGAIVMSIDPPGHGWPDYALNVAAIMTTTANPAQFFIVPGAFPGQSPWWRVNRFAATVILIEATDQYLSTVGQDATPYINQLSQTVAGTAPLQPSQIFACGSRVGYVCLDASNISVCYISDANQPQSINAATSAVYLPGNLPLTLGYSLRGVTYLNGPHWTYATSDSGGNPVNWPAPQLIDGTIGSLGAHCTTQTAGQNNSWVVDDSGLYLFQGGAYPTQPLSYYQRADWARINFTAPNAIQVADDSTNNRVHVLAPLDGATAPTHILTWDYSLGSSPEQAKYSGICNLTGYSPGAICMVQGALKHQDKWLFPGTAGQPIGRECVGSEQYPFRDFGQIIDSAYETAVVPRGAAGTLIQAQAAQIRITGAGTAQMTVFAIDHAPQPDMPGAAQGDPLGPFTIPEFGTLADAGAEYLQTFWLENEYMSIQIETDGQLDSWFQISRLNLYYTLAMGWR